MFFLIFTLSSSATNAQTLDICCPMKEVMVVVTTKMMMFSKIFTI